MGEIKSTLDLVMEKTKHLTLSKAEEQEQKYDEINKRLKGLVHKYRDKALKRKEFEHELNNMRKTFGSEVSDILIRQLLDDLNLNQDNEPFLSLLKDVCGKDTTELASVFDEYQDKILLVTQEGMNRIKENLAEKHFISGSAVVPNLKTDPVWTATVRDIHGKFERALNEKKAGLIAAPSS